MEGLSDSSDELKEVLDQSIKVDNETFLKELDGIPRSGVQLSKTFSVDDTLLMDIGDSVLHEVSSISLSQEESLLDLPVLDDSSTLHQEETYKDLMDQGKDDPSAVHQSGEETLLEDIGDSVLNYSTDTDQLHDDDNDDEACICKERNILSCLQNTVSNEDCVNVTRTLVDVENCDIPGLLSTPQKYTIDLIFSSDTNIECCSSSKTTPLVIEGQMNKTVSALSREDKSEKVKVSIATGISINTGFDVENKDIDRKMEDRDSHRNDEEISEHNEKGSVSNQSTEEKISTPGQKRKSREDYYCPQISCSYSQNSFISKKDFNSSQVIEATNVCDVSPGKLTGEGVKSTFKIINHFEFQSPGKISDGFQTGSPSQHISVNFQSDCSDTLQKHKQVLSIQEKLHFIEEEKKYFESSEVFSTESHCSNKTTSTPCDHDTAGLLDQKISLFQSKEYNSSSNSPEMSKDLHFPEVKKLPALQHLVALPPESLPSLAVSDEPLGLPVDGDKPLLISARQDEYVFTSNDKNVLLSLTADESEIIPLPTDKDEVPLPAGGDEPLPSLIDNNEPFPLPVDEHQPPSSPAERDIPSSSSTDGDQPLPSPANKVKTLHSQSDRDEFLPSPAEGDKPIPSPADGDEPLPLPADRHESLPSLPKGDESSPLPSNWDESLPLPADGGESLRSPADGYDPLPSLAHGDDPLPSPADRDEPLLPPVDRDKPLPPPTDGDELSPSPTKGNEPLSLPAYWLKLIHSLPKGNEPLFFPTYEDYSLSSPADREEPLPLLSEGNKPLPFPTVVDETLPLADKDEPLPSPAERDKPLPSPVDWDQHLPPLADRDVLMSSPIDGDQPLPSPADGDQPLPLPADEDQPLPSPADDQLLHSPADSDQLLHSPADSDQLLHSPADSDQLLHSPADGDQLLHSPADGDQLLHSPADGEQLLHSPADGGRLLHSPADGKQLLHSPTDGDQPLALPPNEDEFSTSPADRDKPLSLQIDEFEAILLPSDCYKPLPSLADGSEQTLLTSTVGNELVSSSTNMDEALTSADGNKPLPIFTNSNESLPSPAVGDEPLASLADWNESLPSPANDLEPLTSPADGDKPLPSPADGDESLVLPASEGKHLTSLIVENEHLTCGIPLPAHRDGPLHSDKHESLPGDDDPLFIPAKKESSLLHPKDKPIYLPGKETEERSCMLDFSPVKSTDDYESIPVEYTLNISRPDNDFGDNFVTESNIQDISTGLFQDKDYKESHEPSRLSDVNVSLKEDSLLDQRKWHTPRDSRGSSIFGSFVHSASHKNRNEYSEKSTRFICKAGSIPNKKSSSKYDRKKLPLWSSKKNSPMMVDTKTQKASCEGDLFQGDSIFFEKSLCRGRKGNVDKDTSAISVEFEERIITHKKHNADEIESTKDMQSFSGKKDHSPEKTVKNQVLELHYEESSPAKGNGKFSQNLKSRSLQISKGASLPFILEKEKPVMLDPWEIDYNHTECPGGGHAASPRMEDFKVVTDIEFPTFWEEVYSGIGEGAFNPKDIHDACRKKHLRTSEESFPVKAIPMEASLPTYMSEPSDIVEQVFYNCDRERRGLVSAGILADQLAVVLVELQPRLLITTLQEALCRGGAERQLDINTYFYILTCWMQTHFMDGSLRCNYDQVEKRNIPDVMIDQAEERNCLVCIDQVGQNNSRHDIDHSEQRTSHDVNDLAEQRTLSDGSNANGNAGTSLQSCVIACIPDRILPNHRVSFASIMTPRQAKICGPLFSHIPTPYPHPLPYCTSPKLNHQPFDTSESDFEDYDKDDFKLPLRRKLVYEETTLEHHFLLTSDRRSTLLPGVRGSRGFVGRENDTEEGGEEASLDMSHPPSPIAPPAAAAAAAATSFYRNSMTAAIHRTRGNTACNVSFAEDSREAQQSSHSNYMFGEVATPFREPDREELQEDLRELERTNRHLLEKNTELNYQIQSSEDANNSLRQQYQYLEDRLKSLQNQLKDKDRLEEEISELHNLLDIEREEKEEARAKICVVENEKNALSTMLENVQTELKTREEDVEQLMRREANLLEEKETEVAALTKVLQQLSTESKAVECMKVQNENLQDVLQHLEEENHFLREKLNSCLSVSVNETTSVVEEDDVQVNPRNKISKMPWNPEVILSSPFDTNISIRSNPDTPRSIHSEIHMMADNDGSLPFCEKSEDGLLSPSSSPEGNLSMQSGKVDASSLSLLTSILNFCREREGPNALLGKELDDEKASALYSYFLKHHDELLKLEKELQNILRKMHIGQSPSSGKSTLSNSSSLPRQSSRNSSSSAGNRTPEPNLENPDSLSSVQTNICRTPGPLVSNLISKFELSSPSPSLSYSENKKKPVAKVSEESNSGSSESKGNESSHDYNYFKDSKILSRFKLNQQETGDEMLDDNKNLIPSGQQNDEVSNNSSENALEAQTGSLPHSCNTSDVLDSGFEQEANYSIIIAGSQPLHEHFAKEVTQGDCTGEKGVFLRGGLDQCDSEGDESLLTPLKRKLVYKVNTPSTAGNTEVEINVDMESDVYMESSQLMKLMKKVKELEENLKIVKQQLSETEEESDGKTSELLKIYRLIIVVSRDIFRWTETVRKEWLSAVPVGREDEGASAPLRTPDTLDDLPITTTHSREEIESLIQTRCDLGCQVSQDDLVKDYVNPESLAIELERELLALKLHVARSHALLHHYQSSSLHGSRSEVSTPLATAAGHHVQGVEAAVEADLCGPTCIPRPCDSTATQTPASPISASPECEASVGEEASGSLSNEGGGDDPLQDDHRPLTPQHRPLYQRMSVSEEEVEEESACGQDMAVSSDHVIYAPKPTYDQLDQYSGRQRRCDEKHRRSGLSGIKPQVVGVGVRGGGGGNASSVSDEDKKTKEIKQQQTSLYPTSPIRSPRHPPINRLQRCHSVGNDCCIHRSQSVSGCVFPSFQDGQLRALGVSIHDPPPTNENLSPQEIENKFKQLSLAFKTDRLTLRQRLDVQQRQRDIAEANFERELNQLRSSVLALHEDCIDMELADAITQVRKHIDVLTTSSSSLLSASEVWGAVQQEWRVSRALEVLFLHEENVTRLYENDHQELEGMRRLLAEHQIELPGLPGSTSENQSSSTDSANKRMRALSLVGLSKQQSQESGSRRISLGPNASKTVLNSFLGTRSARRRISLMPDLRPFHQELTVVTAAAVAANADSKKEEEEKPQPGNGMLSSSITEEGSESGDDGTNEVHQDVNNSIVPSAASLRRLTVLYGQAIQNPDQRSHEDGNVSQGHSQSESHLSSNLAASAVPQPQNWVLHNIKELIGLLREGEWPYTSQQLIRGAFTSFLLMLAVFYLILATSSASDELPEPCRPDWTISIRRRGLPPI